MPIQDVTHIIVLGRNGVGKTVMSKSFVEDALYAHIPVILLDIKGDLVSLLIQKSLRRILDHHQKAYRHFWNDVDFRVFTPKTEEGTHQISLNPFIPHYRSRLDDIDLQLYIDNVAHTIASMIIFKPKTNERSTFIDELTQIIDQYSGEFVNIDHLLAHLESVDKNSTIYRKLSKINVGSKRVLLNRGEPLDMNLFVRRRKGKTPLNIISTLPLVTEEERDLFISVLTTMIHRWGLTYQRETKQLLYGIDEVYEFLPARRKTQSKAPLKTLVRQGRGLGIMCMFCSNVVGDLDYEVFEQPNLWVFGNMVTRSNLSKIKDVFKPIEEDYDKNVKMITNLRRNELIVFFEREMFHIEDIWQVFSIHKPVSRIELRELCEETELKKMYNDERMKTIGKTPKEVKAMLKRIGHKERRYICPSCYQVTNNREICIHCGSAIFTDKSKIKNTIGTNIESRF